MPFVPSEKEYELVFIREGERVVIPCRGSVENLNVTLYTVRKSCFCYSYAKLADTVNYIIPRFCT